MLLTNRITFDRLKFTDAERSGFDASVERIPCEIGNERNEREQKSMLSPDFKRK
jgi:hypothetical protein